MKRPPRPDELRLWARVAATVRPARGRDAPKIAEAAAQPHDGLLLPSARAATRSPQPLGAPLSSHPKPVAALQAIEPGRMRRLTREREVIGPRLDLHGLDQIGARAALAAFLRRASEDGWRSVLVITGKGSRGEGVLRRAAPEWLAEPGLRDLVAGVSSAHRRHGGDGALYVALKRPTRTRP